jgi:alpha-ribazole phosphatase/probable phosphoglycerate mutase
MAIELIYETHSITIDNETGHATGWLPGELSEQGRGLAAKLGERRRNDRIAVVFVSDLRRAVQTAEIAFAGTKMPIRHDARLRECNYGDRNSMPSSELHGNRVRHIDTPYPNGESYQQVVTRMADFLRDLAATHDGQRVLMISHSANRWALDCLLNGARLEEIVDAPFEWQEGWVYEVPAAWQGPA